MEGHVLIVTLECDHGHHQKWASSPRCGNRYQLNVDFAVAWEMSGSEKIKYRSFWRAAGSHALALRSYAKIIDLFHQKVVTVEEERVLAENRQRLLGSSTPIVLDLDGSHCRSHRPVRLGPGKAWAKGGPAPHATTTAMFKSYIVHQEHIHLKDLREEKANATGRERKDDIGMRRALEKLSPHVPQIARVVTDGCVSAKKIVTDFTRKFPQHKGAEVSKDTWHWLKGWKKKITTSLKKKRPIPKTPAPKEPATPRVRNGPAVSSATKEAIINYVSSPKSTSTNQSPQPEQSDEEEGEDEDDEEEAHSEEGEDEEGTS
jgi:hypothetical protein